MLGEEGGGFVNFGVDEVVNLLEGHAWVDTRLRIERGDMWRIVG